MKHKNSLFRFVQVLMPLGLVATLTACPPPPPVVQLYQADLVNQIGTSMTGKVDGTLNTSTLTLAGDIFNAPPATTFTATITCSQTKNLNIGFANGNPTVFGDFTGTEADRTELTNQRCYISVFTGGTLVLKGFLRSKG